MSRCRAGWAITLAGERGKGPRDAHRVDPARARRGYMTSRKALTATRELVARLLRNARDHLHEADRHRQGSFLRGLHLGWADGYRASAAALASEIGEEVPSMEALEHEVLDEFQQPIRDPHRGERAIEDIRACAATQEGK